MDVDGGVEIMQQGRVGSFRGAYIIHSGKSISREYSGVRCVNVSPTRVGGGGEGGGAVKLCVTD